MTDTHRTAIKATVLAVFIAAFALYWSWPAFSHEFYSLYCCNTTDCAPLPDGSVKATADGWYVQITDETIPYNDSRIQASPDGRFHGCIIGNATNLRCLYVPGQGS